MKLLRGKNWVQLNFDKKARNGLYIGPLFIDDREVSGKYRYKLLSFLSRRFKLRIIKDRQNKFWEFHFGGLWSSQATQDEYINYTMTVSKFKDEG